MYLIDSPSDSYAALALQAAITLDDAFKSSWIGDLRHVLQSFPTPILLPDLHSLDSHLVDGCIKSVKQAGKLYLQSEIDKSSRLYLLHGQLEPFPDSQPKYQAVWFRHYLNVPIAKHRLAITRLLLAEHRFAMEYLRRATAHRARVDDPNMRLCRFCGVHTETPEHVMLVCNGNDRIIEWRLELFQATQQFFHNLHLDRQQIHPDYALRILKKLIFHSEAINSVARFAYLIQELLEEVPIRVP